jgi:Domain of Unknown Function (DUF748)
LSEAPEAAAVGAPHRRRRRWPWIVLGVAVALGIGLRVALPTAVERGVAWGSRYYLGLPARIDNVDFELLGGRVVLEGITVGARPDGVTPRDAALEPPAIDAAQALVHVARVATELSWRDLRHHTVRLVSMTVDAPAMRVARESDGKVDPLRWAEPLAPKSTEPAPTEPAEPSEPWKIALDRFELSAPDVRVIDTPSSEEMIALSLDRFALDRIAVRGSEFELGGVGIEGPVLRARRDLLLQKPAAAPANAPAPANPAAPSAAPPPTRPGYHVAKVDVDRMKFTWITEKGPLDVAITLRATDISADQGARFPLDLKMEIGDGWMEVAGDVGIVPPAYTGKLTWSGIPIPRVLLASVPQLAVWLRQAKSSGDLALDADVTGVKGEPSMRVAGPLSFDALDVEDPKGDEVTLGWKQLAVVMHEVYAPLPQEGKPLGTTKAALDSVKLIEPKIRYTRPSPQLDALLGINLSGTPAPKGAKAAEKGSAPPPAPKPVQGATEKGPLDLAIASLEMAGGEIEALDKTVKPVARTRIHGLSLVAKDVRYPDVAVADLKFKGVLPTTAQLDVAGKLAPGNVGDFTLKLRKLDLPVFNPYASAAAGVTVDEGDASVDAKIKLRGAKMNIDNHLVLHQLGVSMREPETFERSFGVPLDLALALLRDPKGNIALHIPVAVDEKGAKLGIGAIVASAIKSALIGAVTAPLKMIGAMFGGGGEGGALSIDPLPSVAGQTALDGDQSARLDGLAKMMGERPTVALSLRGRVGPDDRPKVAEQMLIERWQADDGLPELEGTNILSRRRIGQALARRAKGEPTQLEAEDQALYDRYVASVAVPDERLAALAKSRAEVVRGELVAKGVAAPRLAVGEPEAEATPGVVIAFRSGG